MATLGWGIMVKTDIGKFLVRMDNEQAVNTKITQLKGQASSGWMEFGDIHIRSEKVVSMEKVKVANPESPDPE